MMVLPGLWLVVSFLLGCEVMEPPPPKPIGPKLYPVRGRVTLEGKPLARAVVAFLPTFSVGTHCVGETKADGTYELSHLGQPGAGRGEYRVVVSYIVGPNGQVADLASRSLDYIPYELNNGKELLPPHYSNFSRSELRATVTPDCPPINFELKGSLLPPPLPAIPLREWKPKSSVPEEAKARP
jgi:hypothetical protein